MTARSSTTPRRSATRSHAVESAGLDCGAVANGVSYARFRDVHDVRRDVLANPPVTSVCIYGSQIVLDALDPGMFCRMCARLKGHVVDGTRGLPLLSNADFGPRAEAEKRALVGYLGLRR